MGVVETGPLVVASTHKLEKYGGRFRLTRGELENLAAYYGSPATRVTFQHDPTKPSTLRALSTIIEPTGDGEYALKVNFEADEDEWTTWLKDGRKHGAPLGFSYTRYIPFAGPKGVEPTFVIAADAEFYTQDDIRRAAERLDMDEPVILAELAQFAASDLCQVVVEVQRAPSTLDTWGPAVLESVWPVLLALAKLGRWVRYKVRLRRQHGGALDGVVDTDDPAVLAQAGEDAAKLDPAWRDVSAGHVLVYDPTKRLWLPPA